MSTYTTWRSKYFKEGKKYKILKPFDQDRRTSPIWVIGEVLEFINTSFSIYHSCTGYLFQVEGSDQVHAIDLYDDQPEPNWSEYFEEVNE